MTSLGANNGEGGTDGTTVSFANSGGASGTPFTPTIGSGAVFKFSATDAAHGNLGYQVSTGSTSTNVFGRMALTSAKDHIFGSIYLKIPTFANASTSSYAVRFQGAGVQACRINFTTSAHIKMSDTSTSNSVNGTVAANVLTYFRLDFDIVVSTGTFTVWLFNTPDGAIGTHVDSITGTGKLFGSNPIDSIDVGIVAGNSLIGPWSFDDLRIDDTTVPGPVSTNVTISDTGTLGLNLVTTESIFVDTVVTDSGTVSLGLLASESVSPDLLVVDSGSVSLGLVATESVAADLVFNDAGTVSLGLVATESVAADVLIADVGSLGLGVAVAETIVSDVVIGNVSMVSLGLATFESTAADVVISDSPQVNLNLASIESVLADLFAQDTGDVNLGLLSAEWYDVLLLDSADVNLGLIASDEIRNSKVATPRVFVSLASKSTNVDLAAKTKAIDLATKRVVITLEQ